MKKIFIILFSLTLSLFGYTSIKHLKYESGISIYGQVGYVDLKLEENFDTQTYFMQATTTSTGLVKVLTDNRIDTFTSNGQIIDGVYKPLKFIKRTTQTDYEKLTTYTFDYENNTVVKSQVKSEYKVISTFNIDTFSHDDERKLFVEKSSETLKLEANDYLSLYLNLKHGNLKVGTVEYVDKKDEDTLLFLGDNLFEVQKNFGEDNYKISMKHDEKSIFFKKIESIGISFYGDAYIEKLSETTDIIESS